MIRPVDSWAASGYELLVLGMGRGKFLVSDASAQLTLKVVIRCRDFKESYRFYHDILGLNVVQDWEEDEGRGCIFHFGGQNSTGWLEIYEMTEQDSRHDLAFSRPLADDKIDLQLRTSSLDYWTERLAGRWPYVGPETLPWGQRWIKLRDPDRLLVAIYEELG